MFLPTYRFEHPITGRTIRITGFSYLLAAFGGPIYAAAIGRRPWVILMSMVVSGIYTAGIVGVVGFAAMYLDSAKAIITLAFLIPAAMVFHGRSTMFVLREDFRRRGWMVGID